MDPWYSHEFADENDDVKLFELSGGKLVVVVAKREISRRHPAVCLEQDTDFLRSTEASRSQATPLINVRPQPHSFSYSPRRPGK